LLLRTRETVDLDTPAARATSEMLVTPAPERASQRKKGGGRGGLTRPHTRGTV
jgi:hypothetical protein